jgi:hypothetical protein
MRLTALLCAFLACCEFKRESTGFLLAAKTSSADVVYLLQNLSNMIALGLLLMLLQFLIRWHFVKRLEHLAEIPKSREEI